MVNSTTVLRRPQPEALTRGGAGGRLTEVPVRTHAVRFAVCGTIQPTHNVCDLSNGAPSPDRDVYRNAEVALCSGIL